MPASLRHLKQLIREREQQSEKNSVSAVLAKWPADQKYYAVEVLACDKKDRKCKVKFEDNYECWMGADNIHLQLCLESLEDDELVQQIVCCVCDDGVSKPPNEIVICDTCQQGYHLECHNPVLKRTDAKLDVEEEEWMCATCIQLLNMPDGGQEEELKSTIKTTSLSSASPKPKPRSRPPMAAVINSQKSTASPAPEPNESAKKPVKPRKPESNSQKAKKTTKIKLTNNGAKKEQMPMTSTVIDLMSDQ